MNAQVAAHRHVLMPWTVQSKQSDAPMIVGGDGNYFISDEGRRILDFSSGWVATNLGHGHPTVIAAIKQQLDRLCWAPPNFQNDVRSRLASELSDLSPWPEGCRTHFVTGGGEANDDALKIARLLSGRGKVMSAYRSYHGCTHAASGLTGGKRRWASEPYTPAGVVRFWAPMPFRSPFYTEDPTEERDRALDHFERVIAQEDPEKIAAVILEPIVGSDGLVVYPDGYLQGIREITARHGILLIFDEVMTGFGRVGEAFAAIRLNIQPDIITFAKASSAAYIPLGGVMIRESLAQHFDHELFDAGHTHAGHPIAMAAGLGALEAYKKDNLFKKGYEIEGWILDGFKRLSQRHACVGDYRGKGAFFGLEMVRDRSTKEPITPWQAPNNGEMQYFFKELLANGLWLHGKYSISVMAPPLTISKAEIEEGFGILDHVLEKFEKRLAIGT